MNGFRGVLSQADGTFHIEKIQPGKYLLRIRNVGFETWISDTVNVEPGVALDVSNIFLETKVNNLDEVVITTKKPLLKCTQIRSCSM